MTSRISRGSTHPPVRSAATAVAVVAGSTFVLGGTGGAAPPLPANCTASGVTVTCSYSRETTTAFTVPAGVHAISVDLVGGSGGTGQDIGGSGVPGVPGGRGARVTGEVLVAPGRTYHVVVAGNGDVRGGGGGPLLNGGGYNGGGAAASGGVGTSSGGGGGMTDIRQAVDQPGTALAAAAGGGGGGARNSGFATQGSGGAAGEDGVRSQSLITFNSTSPGLSGDHGGQGGSDLAGDGGVGVGGHGEVGEPYTGGGGGGAGLVGGGGGEAGYMGGVVKPSYNGAGGGGGASRVPFGGTFAVDTTGTPRATITFQLAPETATASPTSLSFGFQNNNTTSAARSVTFTATGPGVLRVDNVSVTGAHPNDFLKQSDTCTGRTFNTGQTCAVTVAFRPTASNLRNAVLAFGNNTYLGPQAVNMSGIGVGAVPTATITSPSTVSATLRQSITGTASDPDGPGIYGVVLYYRNNTTGRTVRVAVSCSQPCGPGVLSTGWSYVLPTNGPNGDGLGSYTFTAQAFDTNFYGGPGVSKTINLV